MIGNEITMGNLWTRLVGVSNGTGSTIGALSTVESLECAACEFIPATEDALVPHYALHPDAEYTVRDRCPYR